MLEAFLRQSNIDDGAADRRNDAIEESSKKNVQEAGKQLFSDQSISKAMDIPTQFPDPVIKESDIPKEGEKGFTEINRWTHVGGKTPVEGGDVEMGDVGPETEVL